ncbi:hypothetical protein BD31_I1437, partial [Candidatus Nitrosopumilus salaria BD31]
MRDDALCHCGSCGHEKTDECYTKQCSCCLSDHQGAFGKNNKIRLKMTTKKNNFKLPKKRIPKILVPLDDSKCSIHALNSAINLAKFTDSKIVGIFVIPSDVSPLPLDDLF